MLKILTETQAKFLDAFFKLSESMGFFLTGGTALAEYYLQHRYSEDIDLFTLDKDLHLAIAPQIERLAEANNLKLVSTQKFGDQHRFIFADPDDDSMTLKVETVREVGPQFGEKKKIGNIIVDSLENIGANKICAILGRTEIKDFVDLYFILKEGLKFDDLFERAKQKDSGLTDFYFAGTLLEIEKLEHLPRMIKEIAIEELRDYFSRLANDLFDKIKPKEES